MGPRPIHVPLVVFATGVFSTKPNGDKIAGVA